ncbi:hypothetical protein ACIA49_37225 [Kribbella sp. NPDC051587]|uniref:hypothetical protein n=1 Tax=Kribbella sp. NPDC051587 TaxID=3364119 RepID=UPI003793AD5C
MTTDASGNQLRAARTGTAERFRWIDTGNGFVDLQAASNGKYVPARADEAESPLRAKSGVQGEWEKYSWGAT